MWNWQKKDWTKFSYDSSALKDFEDCFLKNAGEHIGAFKHISNEEKEILKIELISDEALKTSKIEGEILDRDSLQSSICRQFGLKTDNRRIPPSEHGVASMMVDLYKNFNQIMSHGLLFNWHKFLMNNRVDITNIGCYRSLKEPMQVVSGAIYNPKVHFEAPPCDIVAEEMDKFINWFNETNLPALTKSGIAHLYFVSIHPFEDGNGRIARAIAEKSLAISLGEPSLVALSYTIEKHRKEYYDMLEKSNKCNEITAWLIYFAKTILKAQENTKKRIEFIIEKAKLYEKLHGQLNERQQKVIERMFREGIDGFIGGLSAENYITITNAPRATATRDLHDLVKKEALIKKGKLKHTRYYLNIKSEN